jgi:hypothetical protein
MMTDKVTGSGTSIRHLPYPLLQRSPRKGWTEAVTPFVSRQVIYRDSFWNGVIFLTVEISKEPRRD